MNFSIICLLVAASITATAQESSSILPEAPASAVVQPAAKPIAAPSRLRFALESTDTLLRGLDAYTSHKLFSDPCHCYHEMNPIAPPTGHAAAQIAFQSGAGFLVMGGSRWLERRGHKRWARAVLIADIVSESIAVGNNFVVAGMKQPPALAPVPSKPASEVGPVFRANRGNLQIMR